MEYFCIVANSFSSQIIYDRQPILAVIVPNLRRDGMHYEVNLKGFPRFTMSWSQLGRYDLTDNEVSIPYEVILAVSDVIEKKIGKKR